MPPVWVVYGAHTIVGCALLDLLRVKPLHVVAVQERPLPPLPPPPDEGNVRYVRGDALSADEVRSVCSGAQVMLCAIELHRSTRAWAEGWPPVVANLTAAAKEAGAVLGFVDELYAHGPGIIDMHTPTVRPGTHSKPAISAAIRKQLLASGATFVCVAANETFGPHDTASPLGRIGAARIVQGEAPFIFGSADRRRDMAYVPDVARALLAAVEAVLDGDGDAARRFWIAPHAIKFQSLREVTRDMSIIVDRPNVANKVITWPSLAIHLFAACNPVFAEYRELLPWVTMDYGVYDDDFCRRFQMKPTAYNRALTDTMRWFEEERLHSQSGGS